MLYTVYTSETILQKQLSRTRVCALKFNDVHDRPEFVNSLLHRIKLAKGRLHQNFGFEARSATFVVEGAFVWVIVISLAAMSFCRWHKVFVRIGALDLKISCIHRHRSAGSQSSLETAADMFGDLISIEELASHEIRCEVPPEELQKALGKRSKLGAGEKRKTKKRRLPPDTAGSAERHVPEPSGAGSSRMASASGMDSADRELVDECVAFLTSKDMPLVEPHLARLSQHLASASSHTQIGLYLLSRQPLELLARVVHLRTALVRALWVVYGVDARLSLATTSLVRSVNYERVPPRSQAALRMVSQCMDTSKDLPIFALMDTVWVAHSHPGCFFWLMNPIAGRDRHAGERVRRQAGSQGGRGRPGDPVFRQLQAHCGGGAGACALLRERAGLTYLIFAANLVVGRDGVQDQQFFER